MSWDSGSAIDLGKQSSAASPFGGRDRFAGIYVEISEIFDGKQIRVSAIENALEERCEDSR